MSNINYKYKYNSDDIFFRHVFAGITETLTNDISYTQIESDTTKRVIRVPFYLRATGQERFLHYYFSGKNYETCEEFVEGSFDIVPRGVLSLEDFNIVSGETTSPHARGVLYESDEQGRILQYSSKIKSIPMLLSFNLEIRTSTLNESWKIAQNLTKQLYYTKSFYFYYDGLVVPALIKFPDNTTFEGKLFKFSYGEVEKPTQKIQIECKTFLPIIRENTKNFSGNRITQFKHNYQVDDDIPTEENLILELWGRLSGRILYEDGAEPYDGVINLVDAENTVVSSAILDDGYYYFNKISPKIGYRIENSETSAVLKRNITIYPNHDKSLNFEV